MIVWSDGMAMHPSQSAMSDHAPNDDERTFWLHVSQTALEAIWDNPQDDIYAELLEK